MMFSKVIVVFDDDVDVQDPAVALWRGLANLDPKRDMSFVEGPIDQLDHGANQALFGGKVCVDATRKWPEEGYRRDWPEVCRFPADVAARALSVVRELGLEGSGASGSGATGSRPFPSAVPSTPNGPALADRLRDVLERLANGGKPG